MLARRRLFEQLEDRRLLAGDWHNDFISNDVNNDLRVTALDALIVVNRLSSEANDSLPELEPGAKPDHFYDTTGDDYLSALDALWVINDIGVQGEKEASPPPRVIDVVPVNETTILASFDRPMGFSAIDPANYKLTPADGQPVEVLEAQFGEGESVVQLRTAPQAEGGDYTIEIDNVADAEGRTVDFSATKLPSGKPYNALLSAAATSPTRVVVVFGEEVSDSALVPHHYEIRDAAGNSLRVTDVEPDGPEGMVVVLTTETQASVPYQLTVSHVTDSRGNHLRYGSGNFHGISGFPELTAAAPAGPNSVLLTYTRAMSDDALAPTSYVVRDSNGGLLPVLTAQFVGTERRLVQLVTGPQTPQIYTIESAQVSDVDGNSVLDVGAAGEFQGAPAASLLTAIPTDSNHLILTFGSELGDSAMSPTSYLLEELDSSGDVTAIVPVTDVAFVGSQRTVVSLTTIQLSNSQYRISTTTGLTDANGSSLPNTPVTFQGTGRETQLIAIASTSATSVVVTFDAAMSDDALSPSLYTVHEESGAALRILRAEFIGSERRLVRLTTSPQTSGSYKVESIGATDLGGNAVTVPTAPSIRTFQGPTGSVGSSVPVEGPPRVVGAASLSNTSVLVSFNEPMADNALNPAHYVVVQESVNPEAGYLPILNAEFSDNDRRSIVLTTGSQNELTYAVTAVNVTDQAGTALASAVIAGHQRIDPTTALFPGTPPSGIEIVDTDGDGLSDNVEVRGWVVTITRVDGSTYTREVTSDPNNPDTDGDDLGDAQELNIGTDPRSVDTDGDQLHDWAEFNEIYTDPANQDSDGDSLDDFLEFDFFKTSPYLADSDGDQITDDDEIFANRNPRVSDLPRPEITVGEVDLRLDVRFSESNDQERRDLETREVSSTLSQSARQSFSRSDTVNVEAHLEAQFGINDGQGGNEGGFLRTIVGTSVGYTFEQSSESETETQQEYERSLSTDREVTRGYTVERTVEGASMKVTVELRNVSELAYRLKNLQITAFIQDPQDHSRLTPVATLLPDAEPEEGYTLGPLVGEKGPLVFSNDEIIPSLVESLMANSSGMIFRISNYDIIDEDDRNFAFTSQEIVERTSRLVIDFGGASSLRALLGGETLDELQPGDETEIYRVATSAGQVIDTNFDNTIDDSDRRAIFDGDGKEVGINLFEALDAIGLTRYEARGTSNTWNGLLAEYAVDQPSGTPPVDLSDDEILASYSTYVDAEGREKIYRIRGITNDAINEKYWEILTPTGIDQVTDLNDLVLKSSSPVSLNFVQDLDGDRLSADVEYFLRTSDSPLPAGANVPGSTDFTLHESVTFSTDPGYETGTLVRVTETSGNLRDHRDYFVRKLDDEFVDGSASFAFYPSRFAASNLDSTTGRIDLSSPIVAGIFSPAIPTSTKAGVETVSFDPDPGYATATIVHVTTDDGPLVAGTDYYVRNRGEGAYSFYDTPLNATAGTSTGRVNFNDETEIKAGFFSPTAKGRDTDGDGLDDRFEALIGWVVTTPQYTYRAYPSPNRADSNFDGPSPVTDSDEDGKEDRLEYDSSDFFAAPDGWHDRNGDGLRDRFEVYQQPLLPEVRDRDYILDPSRKDTDRDGISDATEIIGFRITRIENGRTPLIDHTDPNNPFTDSDTFTDGFEKLVGLDPTDGSDTDVDGDGLPDVVEGVGWLIGKPFPEIQSVTVSDAGTFKLQFGIGPSSADNTTSSLPVAATARELEQRLNQLKVIKDQRGAVTVTREKDEFSVTFGGGLEGTNVQPLLSAEATVETRNDGRIRLEEVSRIGHQRGPLTELRGYSSTDSVDTDGDGLTDFEEFFLRTDASWKDTDSDGIDDRVEHLGYSLGHNVAGNDLGIIRTDPLDADTDNDKRSDGDEAELVDIESNAWVVRVRGETPYRVYSNPLVADADYDGLVDGDEFAIDIEDPTRHTDPNKGDTDGDFRDDGVERGPDLLGPTLTNPLAIDTRITVIAESIEITGSSDFDVALSVRTPDNSQVAGLSATPRTIFASDDRQIGRVGFHTFLGGATKVRFLYQTELGFYIFTPPAKTIGINPATGEGYSEIYYNWTGLYDPGANGVPANARFRIWVTNTPEGEGTFITPEEFVYTGNNSVAYYDVGDGGFNTPEIVPPTILDANLPFALRSYTFGLADDERFSIEGHVTVVTPSGNITKQIGGLEGIKAVQSGGQDDTTDVRPVFSWIEVADKFIEEFYFEVKLTDLITARIGFYYLVG